jgi:hypothetical protein
VTSYLLDTVPALASAGITSEAAMRTNRNFFIPPPSVGRDDAERSAAYSLLSFMNGMFVKLD